MTIKPIVIFCIGNPSRGDDALAPQLVRQLIEKNRLENVEIIDDFQLQVEHTLDMEGRDLILFIDASVSAKEPFEFTKLEPLLDASFSTHELSPNALLGIYQQMSNGQGLKAFVLAIKGYQFDLGTELSEKAEENLQQALVFCQKILIDSAL